MNIHFAETASAEIVAFLISEDAGLPKAAAELDESVGGLLSEALAAESFKGKPGQQAFIVLPKSSPARRAVLVGAGKPDARDPRSLERLGAQIYKAQANSGFKTLALHASTAADAVRLAAGVRLAAYRFDTYRTTLKDEDKPKLDDVTLVLKGDETAKKEFVPISAAIDGTYLARDLVNMPPNDLNPETYADKIETLSEYGLEIEVLGEAELEKLGMRSMLGVGQGSVKESKLCIMRWMGSATDGPPVALVGKGVCFDTGGISLKPGAGMEDMRGDMGGSAAVVGAMLALAKRKAKANVVGLVGLVENMPDGNAIRPGDIIKAADGQTIEIQNTDAEGRLVLCDVLWYAQEHYQPSAIVDLATLTGAIVIGLGHHHAGLFTNDDTLATNLTEAGLAEGERVWRFPLGDEYDRQLKSKFADMRNIGGRAAGSITAAQFLQRFIRKDQVWAHLDIAGVAWVEGEKAPTDPSWASGFGPRLLDRWIADNYED
ncbi:MAG: leucyl aminopeptidase [Pseudomonadota bacterium]